MITLKEVAAAANVSTVTASSVLSGVNRVRVSPATAERIHTIAKSLNYVPLAAARGLRTGKTRIIAFVSSSHSKFRSDDTWHESLRGVSDLMWEREERLMLVMSRSREHELEIIRQMAYGRQVDGFIIQNSGATDEEHIDMLVRSERPFVIMGGTPRSDINSVSFDMSAFAADIADELRANGCGAVLLVPPPELDAGVYAPFFEGFARWERETGVRVLQWRGAFVPDSRSLADLAATLNGKKLGIALLRSLLPETVNALENAGLPVDGRSHIVYVSTGEDVILDPAGLSVMHFDNYTLGRRAARLLMALVDRPKDEPAPLPSALTIPPAQRG
jgi:LacI family transcriptional regulator